ncbi:MAG TPA: L-threonylcarbamoyladenylate synthase [Acidobacteriaceae bacterium]|nr:L-threonylcarbamoyladenylate synthase [Acidobacteriaceae bacterium]
MPPTLHLVFSHPADLSRAATLLRDGGLVAFATETVYGLGANALLAEAVAGIFAAKQRPSWDPLIVHLASVEQLSQIAQVPVELAGRVSALADAFWPGPLTLLLPRSPAVPDAVTAGRGLVGVRIPGHPAARALLAAAGVPVAAPSANLFGHTSPTTAAHVLADLDGRIDAVFDAGLTSIGVESTVLDPTQTPMVLYRPGAVTAAQLTAVTGVAVEVFVPTGETRPQSMPSPGVGIRHYAPRARMVLVEGSLAALQAGVAEAEATAQGGKIGVLLPEGWTLNADAVIQSWARWNDPDALAAGLFGGLRALDDSGVPVILCPLPEPGGIGDAIRDRLQKAARPA